MTEKLATRAHQHSRTTRSPHVELLLRLRGMYPEEKKVACQRNEAEVKQLQALGPRVRSATRSHALVVHSLRYAHTFSHSEAYLSQHNVVVRHIWQDSRQRTAARVGR